MNKIKIKKVFVASLLSLMVLSFSAPMFASAMVIRIAPRMAIIRALTPVYRYVAVTSPYPGTINVQRTLVGPFGGTATINSTVNFAPPYYPYPYPYPQPYPCTNGCHY